MPPTRMFSSFFVLFGTKDIGRGPEYVYVACVGRTFFAVYSLSRVDRKFCKRCSSSAQQSSAQCMLTDTKNHNKRIR